MKSRFCFIFAVCIFFAFCCRNQVFGQDEVDYVTKQQSFSLYQKALQAFQIGDYHGCTELCRQAIALDNQNKLVFHLEALSLSESGETEQALLAFREALALDFNFIQCRNNLGLLQMKLGKLDEAKATFTECTKIQPRYPDAHYHLGEILQKKGDLDAAIEEYETATRLNPNYFEAQRDLGLAIYEKASSGLTDIMDCEDKLKTAERLAPTNPMIHYHLGNIYCADGKLDEAEKEFKAALSFDTRLAAAHYELGRLRYYRGDPERCLVEMNLAGKISPTYTEDKKYPSIDIAQLKLMTAKAYEAKGEYAKAFSYYNDVAAMSKTTKEFGKHLKDLSHKDLDKNRRKSGCFDNTVQALLVKGITQADAGEWEAAKGTFTNLATQNPGCFEGWQNLGAAEEVLINLQAAMTDYKKALESAPEYDGLYFNMAYLLEKMGLAADAGAMYQKFHDISGKYPYDSRHIVGLEQEYARQQMRMRGK